jgi:hypothetical protein
LARILYFYLSKKLKTSEWTSPQCLGGGKKPFLAAAMWTPEDRALVGDFDSGQALSDDQYRLIEPFIPLANPGSRPRTTDIRLMLDVILTRSGGSPALI